MNELFKNLQNRETGMRGLQDWERTHIISDINSTSREIDDLNVEYVLTVNVGTTYHVRNNAPEGERNRCREDAERLLSRELYKEVFIGLSRIKVQLNALNARGVGEEIAKLEDIITR